MAFTGPAGYTVIIFLGYIRGEDDARRGASDTFRETSAGIMLASDVY